MLTITEGYAALNKQLHERSDYGSGSWKWAETVADFRSETESVTVLDYGCGKGNLRRALESPDWFLEYDPAVPGKDARPEPADLLVCTDVLEHIEPDLLDNVLDDLARCARRAAFITIATRPAQKFLADGRNAHLIVKPMEWWKPKLEKHFYLLSVEGDAGEFTAKCAKVALVGEIRGKTAVADDLRYQQAVRNCAIVKERVDVDNVPRHDRRVAIVAYGPSLKRTWLDLHIERHAYKSTIVSVSGSHDLLIDSDIVPDIHIEVDPRPHKAWFTREPHPDVTYWIASCCHPSLIDNLVSRGCKVALWHVFNSETDKQIGRADGPDPGCWLIGGGGSVGCRAVTLMYYRGFRSFAMFGMDCSFDPDGAQHAGEHSGKKHHAWNVRVADRWFLSSANMVYTARGFIHNVRNLREISEKAGEPFVKGTSDERVEMLFAGDGLLQAMVQKISQPLAEAAE